MKRQFIGLVLIGLFLFSAGAFAQHTPVVVGDTLIVPPYRALEDLQEGEEEADTLYNSMIYYAANDTLADGSQAHKYYKLMRGYYYMINTYGNEFHEPVVIFADPPTAELHPPIINSCIPPDWSFAGPTLELYDDGEVRNIYFNGQDNAEKGPSWGGAVNMYGTGKTYIIENCWFENYGSGLIMSVFCDEGKVYVNNCHGRNMTNAWDSMWTGQFVAVEGCVPDVVHITNTTTMNTGNFFFGTGLGAREVVIDHNTIYASTRSPFQLTNWTNARVTNNIFVDMFGYSANQEEVETIFNDFVMDGVINVDTLTAGYDTTYGAVITEDMRTLIVKNNVYFNDQALTDFWSDSLLVPPFFNTTTQAMMDDDASYPNFVEENNISDQNPEFTMVQGVESLVKACKRWRTGVPVDFFWGWDADSALYYDIFGDGFPYLWYIGWPLPEDFTYSNETLATASTEGGHVGDLNWYPDELAAYVKPEVTTSVEKAMVNSASEFTLTQNYPNPFNPTTTIDYKLNSAGEVRLTVYNVLGNKVKTIVNKTQSAGTYSVQWDGTNYLSNKVSTGVYFYKLEIGDHSLMNKMMLIR